MLCPPKSHNPEHFAADYQLLPAQGEGESESAFGIQDTANTWLSGEAAVKQSLLVNCLRMTAKRYIYHWTRQPKELAASRGAVALMDC